MPDFSEYEKMPKDFKKLNLDEKALQEINKLKWVVTEKIHGANFSFVYENQKLRFAKRKEYLQWKDDFFGFQLVVNKIEDKVIRLFEELSQNERGDKLILYGELFGGQYPHPNVSAVADVQAIQTGVYYSPDIHFAAFDIAIETQSGKHYLDFESAAQYFRKHDLIQAPTLFTGKLNETLQFNIRVDSQVPKLLALPPLDKNLIEGVVIKPLNHLSTSVAHNRPIIKVKNAEFDEEEKFHEARKWSYSPTVLSKSEELEFLVEELRGYINENRLNSAVSKIGQLDFSNEQRMNSIQQELLNDAFTDFNGNNNQILHDLQAAEKDWIRERIEAEIKKLLSSKSPNRS